MQTSVDAFPLGKQASSRPERREGQVSDDEARLGEKDCTPEINTSEIIVDFQWHFPMDCQWHFPTDVHLSVVCSNGISPL